MSKPRHADQPAAMADDSLENARSILERFTGEKMPNRVRRERTTKAAAARWSK